MFPTVKRLELHNPDNAHKALGALLTTGESIDANAMSEGMLYWLAFAAMSEADAPSVFLVEEPENGLHPARIHDVIGVLRKISETAQVIIATHSPLVINELQPDEISIVTRPPDKGTQVKPMTETKNFEQRSKVYALGELWLSYADGDLEKELTDPSDGTETKASA
jgi:predicted ATPase